MATGVEMLVDMFSEIDDDVFNQMCLQLNTFVYTPEYLPKNPGRKKVEMIPAETYVWETMLRTHRRERNVQCPPLTIINVPYDKKTIKRIDRPIRIKPREIQLVIVNCKRDEGMYLKQSDGY